MYLKPLVPNVDQTNMNSMPLFPLLCGNPLKSTLMSLWQMSLNHFSLLFLQFLKNCCWLVAVIVSGLASNPDYDSARLHITIPAVEELVNPQLSFLLCRVKINTCLWEVFLRVIVSYKSSPIFCLEVRNYKEHHKIAEGKVQASQLHQGPLYT